MEAIISTVVYAVLGLGLMFVGYLFFNKIMPYNFNHEIEEKNPAIGAVLLGIFVATALLVKAAISGEGPVGLTFLSTLARGVGETILYFSIGMILCALGYKLFDWVLPADLDKEIDNHNLGAGLAVAGIFIGIALVIGAVI